MTLRLELSRIDIPFTTSFKHHSAERAATESVWVEARCDTIVGVGEACPRSYVTGEDLVSVQVFFNRYREELTAEIQSFERLRAWSDAHREAIDANPAAWCALELAMIEMFARLEGVPVERLVSLTPLEGQFCYSAVIGDVGVDIFGQIARRYAAMGFSDFKVKLSGELTRDRAVLAALLDLQIDKLRVRVDANNLWHDAEEAVRHLVGLEHPFAGLEEPVAPGQFETMRMVSDRVGCRIILDESLLRSSQLPGLARDPQRWIINIRVSKMGGLLRALEVAGAASDAGIPIVVGAQVGETSVLTRAALVVAHAARRDLFAQEGAFATQLLEHDVADPPLMFGRGGILDVDTLGLADKAGWGLSLVQRRAFLKALPQPAAS